MGEVRQRWARGLWLGTVAGALLCMGGGVSRAQSAAEQALLDKAHALEQSGHNDLAAQTWQQVLLSDPNNQQALEGLARWAKLSGNEAQAEKYIARLRELNPNNPEIERIETLANTKAQNQTLQQAAELARGGHNEEALKIYRQSFGTHPPDNWAQAYYDTEAAMEATREDGIAGLRALAEKYPSDSQYAVDLGRVLTYDAKTRAEGEKILSQYPLDTHAQAVLRQALAWDVQNPAAAEEVRAYLKQHPDDEELAKEWAETEARQERSAAGLAHTPAEEAAFAALSADKLEEAQQRFQALHAAEPNNARVLAGLGFLRMKQSNFAEAMSDFEQAQHNGLRSELIEQSLSAARFWNTMKLGTKALNENRLAESLEQYKAALAMRPESVDALTGLAGLYMKMQQPAMAVPIYEQLAKRQPRLEEPRRGLFMAEAQAGDSRAALATMKEFPSALSARLKKDPDYLRTLATLYAGMGRNAEAGRLLEAAMRLPLTASQQAMKQEILLQYAALLAQDQHPEQAVAVYRAILAGDPMNVHAWQGLVSLEHLAGHDPQAITMVERMPPEAYDNALKDAGFLAMLAAIYQSQNHPDVAQDFLERAVKVYEDNGQAVPISLQLQVAAVDLERNHAAGAYRIYREVLTQHPDRLDAWKGLLAALHRTGHDADALAQIEEIPADVRKTLEADVQYEQTLAGIYAARGMQEAALGLLERIHAQYAALRKAPPADVEIQDAWLLFNTGAERELYQQLMTLGGRTDMTETQRLQVQAIWANWAQRRASQDAAAGDFHRALEILTAAAQAFPGNPVVSQALAAGYLQAGRPKDAMAIYTSLDRTNATPGDYQSMVGAAIAAQNMKQAEAWLREGLAKYPREPKVLAAAAQFEQARGDQARAAEYWRASLNAMPAVSPEADLAHKLMQPESMTQARPGRPTDLASLLNPGAAPDAQSGEVPLPNYRNTNPGASNGYSMGTAPVQLQNGAAGQGKGNADELGPVTPAPQTQGVPLPKFSAPGATSTPEYAPIVPGQPAKTAPARQEDKQKKKAVPPPPPFAPYKPQASVEAPPEEFRVTIVPIGPLGDSDDDRDQGPVRAKAPGPARDKESAMRSAQESGSTVSGVAEPSAAAPPIPTEAQEQSAQIPEQEPAAIRVPAREPEIVRQADSAQEQPPQVIGLDTSPALRPASTASDAGFEAAAATLAAAQRAPAAALAPTQEIAPAQEIAEEQPLPDEPPVFLQAPSMQTENSVPNPAEGLQTTPGVTDNELMQENLPPLRGSYARPAIVRQPDLRKEAQQQLANIEGGYSPWLGGTGLVNHRSGTAGFDSLTMLEAPFEVSAPVGTAARLTVISRPSFLDSGVPTTGPLLPNGVVERLGTAAANAALTQQNASGIGGEVQLALPTFAAALGYSPYGFLVSNVIGRLNWKPGNGPLTVTLTRDSVRDSQLSYAGLRDPGSASPSYAGNIWGGVVASGGEAQFGKGDANSGYYVSGGGQYISGSHVLTNSRIDGDAGAYWRAKVVPDEGTLMVGANFFGMHYTHNEYFFTYGQGGYFSPQAYFLGNVPVSWQGRYGLNLHYTVVGAFGVQGFSQDSAAYFPLDPAVQAANRNPFYAPQTTVGGNYDFHSEAAYHLTDHWFAGGFLSLNNTRDYNNQMVGFYVRYLFRPQYETPESGPTGLYPWDGLRPFLAP